jgi:hypothetical protein
MPIRKQDRSNRYYLELLKSKHPAIHADFLAGSYASLRQALMAAGIRKPRGCLQELKNSWRKASAAERQEFIRWIRTGTRHSASTSLSVPIAVDGQLAPWAKGRINTIVRKRSLRTGGVMRELGFSPLDASLGRALSRGSRLQATLLTALEKWLTANGSV